MKNNRRLPDGPKGMRVLGSLREIQGNFAGFLLQSAQQYGDSFTFAVGPRRAIFFNHPDHVREILQQWQIYRKARVDQDVRRSGLGNFLGLGLLTNDGDRWKQQRKLMQPAFHARYITSYAETMVDYTVQLVQQWSNKQCVNLEQEMMQLTLNIATKTLFDTEVGDYAALGEALTDVQHESITYLKLPVDIPGWLPLPINFRRKRLNDVIDRIVYGIIQDREASGVVDRGDLLSMLMLARDESGTGMDQQQLRDEIITLFIAGHETTALTLCWMFYLLAEHPHIASRLVQEIDQHLGKRRVTLEDLRQLTYLKQVVDETLRLYPAGWLFPRFASQRVELAGYDIEAGDMVLASPYVLHRDPRWFDHPFAFDPDRFCEAKRESIGRYTYLPFGGGPRVCIGNSFALMEMQLISATILQHYRLSLVPDQRIEIEPLITIRPKHGIQMDIQRIGD
jgi:cytochrome P450